MPRIAQHPQQTPCGSDPVDLGVVFTPALSHCLPLLPHTQVTPYAAFFHELISQQQLCKNLDACVMDRVLRELFNAQLADGEQKMYVRGRKKHCTALDEREEQWLEAQKMVLGSSTVLTSDVGTRHGVLNTHHVPGWTLTCEQARARSIAPFTVCAALLLVPL